MCQLHPPSPGVAVRDVDRDRSRWSMNVCHVRFDPHDDSDNLVIAGNTVYNNVNHGE